MRLLFFISMIVIAVNSKAQAMKEIGVGILEVNTSYDISLYKNYNDVTPVAIIHMKQLKDFRVAYECPIVLDPYQMSIGETDIEEEEELVNRGLVALGPVLKFKVTRETSSYYQVILNEEKGMKCYIKKNPKGVYHTTREAFEASGHKESFDVNWMLYETWENYLKRVEFIELNTLEIYDQPRGKIIFCSDTHDFYPFKVKSMKGEWIEVIKDPLREFNFEKEKNYEGWYQWKKGNEWRINMTEFTIE
ncbi:hypothetical protein ABW636_17560 [Aquimarina sp. 2201CG1-2-11]|uniref:hypothetical protein n=1 Tax=Aquimarina discodermiae TaxID=3231043 RepID=UPI003461DCB0